MKYAIRQWLLLAVVGGLVAFGISQLLQIAGPTTGLRMLNDEPVAFEDVTTAAPIVLIMYFDNNCPYCKAMIPVLNQLYKDGQQYNFLIIAINYRDSTSATVDYYRANGIQYPVLVGGKLPGNGVPMFEIWHNGVREEAWTGVDPNLSAEDLYLQFAARIQEHLQ